jgi:hypothetical protein
MNCIPMHNTEEQNSVLSSVILIRKKFIDRYIIKIVRRDKNLELTTKMTSFNSETLHTYMKLLPSFPFSISAHFR